MRRFASVVGCAVTCLLILFVSGGCSCSSSPQRKPIYGKIESKRDVQAVTFRPSPALNGPAATATVSNGSYAFTREDGPIPGHYTAVFIFAEQTNSGFPGGKRKEMKGPQPVPQSDTSPPMPDPEIPVTVPEKGSLEVNITIP